jgi:hypothetical protein
MISCVDSWWGINQCEYPRTHCNYKEYKDFEFMSSNLLKKLCNLCLLIALITSKQGPGGFLKNLNNEITLKSKESML